MKPNELMIGDWVMFDHNPVRVAILGAADKSIGLAAGRHVFGQPFSMIDPISLTQKILEKNGWVYNDEDEKFFPQTWVGGGLMLQGTDDCGYRIVVTSDYDDEDTNNTPFILLYVHELQHALRLRRIKKEIKL